MISDRLKKTILNVLHLEDFEIQDDTRADEVPGWDSLNHINVILAVENEYKVRFKNIEVLKLKNIGDLQKLVDSKTN
ncbi:MAG: acyl carrier protein [Bacteroidota bacterium]|jgi:acyl carrier protein|nr:acyl carrier protein [Ignavibacteria bacterium]HEX2963337.1 acyl carrier protein [Ignavibacteriales bacterium]MCU7500252.1 acyl carrier protein [Ignavibacteria bacterium]MCU7513661.1 acyl carrier protein [Ignavibacteria bacterium]MCU7520636.1 acyl carrier protein [Ignavibacteria bacterium]